MRHHPANIKNTDLQVSSGGGMSMRMIKLVSAWLLAGGPMVLPATSVSQECQPPVFFKPDQNELQAPAKPKSDLEAQLGRQKASDAGAQYANLILPMRPKP